MTTYIRSYLRPLSQSRTGTESQIDDKADEVHSIRCSAFEDLTFRQIDEYQYWINEQAYNGQTLVTSDKEIRINREVPYPERHWWIISEQYLPNIAPPLRDHADIFDLLLALNLSTDDPVFFSQSPGQVVSGAYTLDRGALRYCNDLSIGNIAMALIGANEIPESIKVTGDVRSVYECVRRYRSEPVETDVDMDVRVALEMYDDALDSNLWTAATNLYFVCENVLTAGRTHATQRDQLVASNTELDVEEAESWREMVNRLKHPDEGDVSGLLDQEELEVPVLRRMRKAANTVLRGAMNNK